jgi:hypothetical protein
MVFSCLASKLVAMVSPDLVLKLMVGSLIQSQNKVVGGFPAWTSKPTAMIW